MIKDKIKYDDCVNFSYLNEDTFSSLLYSEYMNFFWIVYQVFGSFKAVITLDKNRDLKEFGRQVAGEYNSIARFSVDGRGKWELKLIHSLEIVKQFPGLNPGNALHFTGKNKYITRSYILHYLIFQ